MNGAEGLMSAAVVAGVDVCFTNPGTTEMHMVGALDSVPGIRAVLALFGERRRPPFRCDESGVTASSLAALDQRDPLTLAYEVSEDRRVVVADDRPERYVEHQVFAMVTVAEVAFTMGPRTCAPVGLPGEPQEARHLGCCCHDDGPTPTA